MGSWWWRLQLLGLSCNFSPERSGYSRAVEGSCWNVGELLFAQGPWQSLRVVAELSISPRAMVREDAKRLLRGLRELRFTHI
jgi:hypothetical protein